MQMAQKKEISPEMVAPILSRKAEMMEAVSRSKALQQPVMQPTVMEQLMSQNIQAENPMAPQIPGQMPQQVAPPPMPPQMQPPMPQEMGVAQLPIPERQYAGGGIIAFAKGDLVDEEGDDEDILAEYAAAMEAGRRASESNYELKAPQQASQQRAPQQSTYGMAYAEPLPKVSGINYKGGKHPYDAMVMAEAEKQGVDPRLASFILNKETGGMKNPEAARSRAGAMGIAQFMPATAKQYNINPDIPSEAAYGMNKHLKYLVNKYEYPKVAAIAYNWGEGNTNKWLKAGADMNKLPKETRNYVATLAQGGEVKHFFAGDPVQAMTDSDIAKLFTSGSQRSKAHKKDVADYKPEYTRNQFDKDPFEVNYPTAIEQAGLTPEEMAAGSTRAGTFEAMNKDTASGMAAPKEAPPPPNKYDTFMEEIAAQRENLAAQRGEDRNMALLAAGLGMMGGTSPYAFANVGQGGLSGVQYLAEANKARAAEKASLDKNQISAMRYKDLGNIAAGDKANMLAIRQGELAVKQNELTEKQRLHNMSSLGQLQKMSEARAAKALSAQGILGVENINDPQMQKQLNNWVEQDLATNKAYNKLYQDTYGFPYDVTPTTTSGGNVMKFDKKGNLVK
jgi:hypothetical protein